MSFESARKLPTMTATPDIISALNSLDDFLAYRTFLASHEISVADWMLWGTIRGT